MNSFIAAHDESLRLAAQCIVQVVVQIAVYAAFNALLNVVLWAWLAWFIAVVASVAASLIAGMFTHEVGYDMAVSGVASAVKFFRGFGADVAAKVQS